LYEEAQALDAARQAGSLPQPYLRVDSCPSHHHTRSVITDAENVVKRLVAIAPCL